MCLRVGALTEPVGCGVRIGELAGDVEGKDCLVIGMGPIGLLSLQILRRKGASRVFVVDLDNQRLAMGKHYGGIAIDPLSQDVVVNILTETDQLGVAVSVDAVGTSVTRTQCINGVMATAKSY